MNKSQKTAAALSAAVVMFALAATPASAASWVGSHACSSSQRVVIQTAIDGVAGSETTTTRHNQIYAGANHYFNFVGFGTKTSHSGSSSSAQYHANTNPSAAAWAPNSLVKTCGPKPA
ncbi:hypothetical protein [Agrococcus sp. Marseille-Q4369]|uniref:hypothetical protein n=1 Tax=Agrococcus sp. Marseille-Q4369 TaxID=2810513 RepID=UPI001B8D1E6C|nr:hypothetical protein [Agrococcus sp. Marseille-Q4369]QUW18648.1 hypothetical protein JSQ78_12800 [Agrococcus sp. Marseille-Q4369]